MKQVNPKKLNFFQKRVLKAFGVDRITSFNPDSFQKLKDLLGGIESYSTYLKGIGDTDLPILYQEYDEMDSGSSDIANMLDIISEEATLLNKEQKSARVWATSEEPTIADKLNKMINRLNLNKSAPDYCRYIGKYGRFVVMPHFVQRGEGANASYYIGWIDDDLNNEKDEKDRFYRTILPDYDENGFWKGYRITDQKDKKFKYWDFAEFKLGNEKYGRSLLVGIKELWRSLDLLEKCLDLTRLTKSPQLLIYGVPTSLSDPIEAINAMNLYKTFLEENAVVRNDGTSSQVNQAKLPSPLEAIFVPMGEDGKKASVEVHESSTDVSNIADVEYKRKKLLSKIYSMIDADSMTKIGDPSKLLSSISLRIMRKVERLQDAFIGGVDRLCQIELSLSDIPIEPELYELHMIMSSDVMETLKMEKLQLALDNTVHLFELADHLDVDKAKWSKFIVQDFLKNYFGDILDKYNMYDTLTNKSEKTKDVISNKSVSESCRSWSPRIYDHIVNFVKSDDVKEVTLNEQK